MTEQGKQTNGATTAPAQPQGTTPPAGEGGAGAGAVAGADKLFTQAELDRIIQDRLARERSKYADYEDLKQGAQKQKTAEEAQKSELQKLQEKVEANDKLMRDLRAERDRERMRTAVFAEAGRKGVPAERLEAASKLLDSSKVRFEEDGTLSGVTEAVVEMLAANPFLLPAPAATEGKGKGAGASTSGANPTNPAAGPKLTREAISKMSAEEINSNWEAVQAALKGG